MHSRRRFLKSSLSALSLLPFSFLIKGCKSDNNTFKIGFLNPKTGADAVSGLSCERAIKLAEALFDKYELKAEIIQIDTESNVESARIKAEKLIQKGVHCLVGAFNSAASAAVAEVAEVNKIPLVINLSAADQITQQGYKYVFRNFPTSSMFVQKGIQSLKDLFIETQFKAKTATFIVVNDSYGQTMLDGMMKEAENLPFKLEEVIQFDYKAKDLSTEVSKIKSINSDVLIVVSRVNTSHLIMRELISQKHNPKLIIGISNQGYFEGPFFKNFSKQSDHIYTIHAWMDPKKEMTKFSMETFYKLYPDEIFELNVGFTLEALYIAALAYKKCQSLDKDIISKTLREMNEEERIIYGGPITFDGNGQRTNLGLVTLMNQDQRPWVVGPEALKEKDPVLPFPGFKS